MWIGRVSLHWLIHKTTVPVFVSDTKIDPSAPLPNRTVRAAVSSTAKPRVWEELIAITCSIFAAYKSQIVNIVDEVDQNGATSRLGTPFHLKIIFRF